MFKAPFSFDGRIRRIEYFLSGIVGGIVFSIAVEDSPVGVRSAYAAGLRVVMVPDLTQPEEEIQPFLSGVAQRLPEVAEYAKIL